MSEYYESTSSGRSAIPLLGDNNFGPWRQKMSDHLMEYDLWFIISGEEEAPDKDSTDPIVRTAYGKYRRKCFRIAAKIRNAMEPHICSKYTDESYNENPKLLWEKLTEGYRKALGLELYYFRQSLFDCTLEAHPTAVKFVHEIERLIECLREAGVEIMPPEKTFYLLHGLPSSWREWRDLQATIIKPDQPEDLIAAIKARESAMIRDKVGETGNDTALAVKGKSYGVGKSGRGFTCGPQVEKSITCYYCQKKGHKRNECRKLKSDSAKGIRQEKVTTAAQVVPTAQLDDSLFTAFSSSSSPLQIDQWLLDSGCSTHVTGLRENFITYSPIPSGEHRIRVANNVEIDAQGRGDVRLVVWDRKKNQQIPFHVSGVLHVPACGKNSLLSVSQLRQSGVFTEFNREGGAALHKSDGSIIEVGETGDLYVLKTISYTSSSGDGFVGEVIASAVDEKLIKEAAL